MGISMGSFGFQVYTNVSFVIIVSLMNVAHNEIMPALFNKGKQYDNVVPDESI